MKPVTVKPPRFFSTGMEAKFIYTIILTLTLSYDSLSEAQVVSHELRRLAVSTNQFGIDVLKALDRIEPPDKVLVFCPACLSSSLMMIMMGSSKYQVVSALRHALYVWSMKPQEINKGFKDIFDHIGLNQYQQSIKPQQQQPSDTNAKFFRKRFTVDNLAHPTRLNNLDTRYTNNGLPDENSKGDSFEMVPSSTNNYLSLPKLMRLREFLERTNEAISIDWTNLNEKTQNIAGLRGLKEAQPSTTFVASLPFNHSNSNTNLNINVKQHKPDLRDHSSDLSQMSAISNIYIQRGLAMNYNYNLLLRQYYKTVIHPVDFIRNGEETRQHINSLVAANTEGKIKDLVGRETFGSTSSPRIMIISTFHFRGILDIQLKAQGLLSSQVNGSKSIDIDRFSNQTSSSGQRQPSPRGPQFFIETEETLLKHGQFSDLGCSVVEIPFNNRLISLVIVMPDNSNSTELLLTKLSAKVLSDMINSLVVNKISVEIPVIKFDRGPINVEGMLKELGLGNLFFGEKLYTSETGLNKWLRPSDIIHETSIDIGTINPKWGQPEDRLKVGAHDIRSSDARIKTRRFADRNHIRLDKPFFYFVLDSINGLVLTMGRIRQ